MNNLVSSSNKVYLTNSEILENISLYRETKDVQYMHRVISNFTKLLIKKARKYKKTGVGIGDLVHYGAEGLIEAIDRSFDLNAKEKFITYITIILERRMKDGLDFHTGAVVFPKNIMTQQRKSTCAANISEYNFTTPESRYTDDENTVIYSKINISNDEDDLRSVINENDEIDNSVEIQIDSQSLQFDIFHILETILTPVERDVIIHYFGLNGESAKAFETIGSILNISSQKIRKIRNSALQKIKNNSKAVSILSKYFN